MQFGKCRQANTHTKQVWWRDPAITPVAHLWVHVHVYLMRRDYIIMPFTVTAALPMPRQNHIGTVLLSKALDIYCLFWSNPADRVLRWGHLRASLPPTACKSGLQVSADTISGRLLKLGLMKHCPCHGSASLVPLYTGEHIWNSSSKKTVLSFGLYQRSCGSPVFFSGLLQHTGPSRPAGFFFDGHMNVDSCLFTVLSLKTFATVFNAEL